MSLIYIDEIQSSMVAYLKANVNAVAYGLASGNVEIREHEWQGTEFTYPNVRVLILDATPDKSNCISEEVNIEVQTFSEEASSYQASRITGIIGDVLHDKTFNSNGLRISAWVTRLNRATRINEATWQSGLLVRATVMRL